MKKTPSKFSKFWISDFIATLNLKGLLVVGMLLVVENSKAQLKQPSIDYLPQTPIASSFSRYGEIPVSYSTGVPEIQIPIYTIKVGDVAVPISISYHSSGIKVRDVASEVGLGFTLNAGGAISATIIGEKDRDNLWPIGSNSYRKSSDIDALIANAYASNNQTVIGGLAEHFWRRLNPDADYHPAVDNFSDRYYYSLCTGESGIFRKDFISGSIKLLPYRPIKIEMPYDIDITSSNGYKHSFKSISNGDYFALDKVESADKTDVLQYYYHENFNNKLEVDYTVTWQHEEPYLEQDPSVCGSESCTPCLRKRMATFANDPDATGGMSNYSSHLLDSMVAKNEVIIFEYIKDRYDDVIGTLSYPSYKRLVKIIVKNKHTRQTIKTFNFSHSYFGTTANHNRRLKLDNITVSGLTSDIVETYSFNYNTSIVLPEYPHLNGAYIDNIWHEDYWGYYNGSSANNLFPSFISGFNIPASTIQYGNREPQWPYASACILTQINYPTGGKTIFEYEPNYVSSNLQDGYVGGLRVKTITSYTDQTSQAFVKTYKYDGAQHAPIVPGYYKWDSPEEHYVWYRKPGCLIWANEYYTIDGKAFSNSLRPMTINNGASIIYTSVTEYVGTESVNIGKTIYGYTSPEDELSRYPIPGNVDTRYISYFHSDVGNYVPQLVGKTYYKNNSGNYEIVRSETHNYSKFRQSEFNTGVSLASKIVLHGMGDAAWPNAIMALLHYDQYYYPSSGYLSSLVYTDTKAFEEVSLETSSAIIDYTNPTTSIHTVTTYAYDNNYTLLTSKTTTASDNSVLRSDYKYPTDFSAQAPYNTMVSRNILTPIVEQAEFKNSNFLQSMRTNYDYWNGSAWSSTATDIIVPRTIEAKTLSNSPEIRTRFSMYDDKSNVTTVSREDDLKNSYIWGYNKTYPVAQVVNAEIKDIFYTSFEEGDGNSVTGDCRTGDKSKTTGLSKSLSNLSNGNYILSYWLKSGSTWTLQKSIVGISNGSYNITLTGQIDEVRFYPEKASLTSYTYIPLIGISSQCDPNNRILYYYYDSFNRLFLIRDQDKNVVKKICYNYAGQTENCLANYYYNGPKSGDFTRNNCANGGIGSTVTYNVAANVYSSTISKEAADQLAQDDVNANGQNYANTHGVCSSPTFSLDYVNSTEEEQYIMLTNTSTSEFFSFYAGAYSSGNLGYIPEGNYDIQIWSPGYVFYTYGAGGCGYSTGGYGANFYNIPLNVSCHYITITPNW